MAKSVFKSIISGSVWGIISKFLDALAKFVTIPLLVKFYGKADYGLVALTFSLNAYLRLMDMGMNIGSIRFFSIWLTQKEYGKIAKVSRSSIVFYGCIGILNAIIFCFMAEYAGSYFKIRPEQLPTYRIMMYILAASTVFNWVSNVVSQLLNAHHELAFTNRLNFITSILNLTTAFVAVKFKISLPVYFFIFTLSTLAVLPLSINRLKVYGMPLTDLLLPKWDGKAFKEIMSYSIAIFAMGIFQVTADHLRPLLLSNFATKGIAVLTEYRVMQTITMLVIAFGGVFMDVLLPSASKIQAENDVEKMKRMLYDGTKYVSVFLTFIVFGLISESKVLLTVYMGEEYTALSIWLVLWLFTVLLVMHNAPVASMVLSSGKTRALVYSSAISCLVSLPVTIIFAKKYDVGAAVLGYLAYVSMQIAFYYLYYIPKVIKEISSARIFFKSFLPTVLGGIVASFAVYLFHLAVQLQPNFLTLVIEGLVFAAVYSAYTLLFVVKSNEVRLLLNRSALK